MTFNTHFVFQTKKVAKQHQLTIKLISKQARLHATKSVRMRAVYKKQSVLMLS